MVEKCVTHTKYIFLISIKSKLDISYYDSLLVRMKALISEIIKVRTVKLFGFKY